MSRVLLIITTCIAVLALHGCDFMPKLSDGEKALEMIRREAYDILGNSEKTLEEIKKLHQIEYKIVTMSLSQPISEIESALNTLGKDRWNCFKFEPHTANTATQELLVFCSRPVYTPIRYLPNPLLLK